MHYCNYDLLLPQRCNFLVGDVLILNECPFIPKSQSIIHNCADVQSLLESHHKYKEALSVGFTFTELRQMHLYSPLSEMKSE